ncbi:unnamed protein product [Leuciscus chuanchicus]
MNGDRWRTDTRSHKRINQGKQAEELERWESMERIVFLKLSLERSHCKTGEEIENKQEEPPANESRETVKLQRCDSMGHLKPDFYDDPVKLECDDSSR